MEEYREGVRVETSEDPLGQVSVEGEGDGSGAGFPAGYGVGCMVTLRPPEEGQ